MVAERPLFCFLFTPVHFFRRSVIQGLMRASRVVEGKIFLKPFPRLIDSSVTLEVDVLIFHTPPQAFRKDVVHAPASAIHADRDVVIGEDIRILGTGKVAALVGVVDMRNRGGQRSF